MNRKLIVSTTAAALLALSACSSDDDDTTSSAGEGSDQTSEPAPGGDSEDREIASDPSGDDTGSVAGLWDAGVEGDERYVDISANGLYTDYDLLGEGEASEGNCYVVTPMQLDLELAAGEGTPATFSIADGRSFTAAVDGDALVVAFLADDSQEGGDVDTDAQSWSAVEGIVTDDLSVCASE